nr:MAG: hypothetical protein 2 [Leviviridae sp.]
MFLTTFKSNNGTVTNEVETVEIPTTDNGTNYQTLVRFANAAGEPGAEPEAVNTSVLSISGSSEETSKGVRRVMVKVEVPYCSLQHTCCGSESGTYAVDASKSGAPITMHIVLTVPKQAINDLQGPAETRSGVLQRVALLQYLLESVIRPARKAYLPTEPTDRTAWSPFQVSVSSNAMTVYGKAGEEILSPDNVWVRGMSLLKPFVTTSTYGPANS